MKLVLDLIGERESRILKKEAGFLPEFIPMKIGAGMTDKRMKMGKVDFKSTCYFNPLALKARVV